MSWRWSPRGVAVKGVEDGDGEGCIGRVVLVIKTCDAVGVVGGVEVYSSPGEGGDVGGVDGNGGFAIEAVERSSINGGVRDGDGVSVGLDSGFVEASEGCKIAIGEGGGDNSGCGSSEGVGLVGGGSAAADVDGFITETCDAVGGKGVDQVISSPGEGVDGAGIDGA